MSNTIPDNEKIESELKKFYRNSEVEASKTPSGLLFVIDSYLVRNVSHHSCLVALLISDGAGQVLVDPESEATRQHVRGSETTITIGSRKWLSVPRRYLWEYDRPAYWFVERNLTEFFRR